MTQKQACTYTLLFVDAPQRRYFETRILRTEISQAEVCKYKLRFIKTLPCFHA